MTANKPTVAEQKRRAAEFIKKRRHAKGARNLKHGGKKTVDEPGRGITIHIRQHDSLDLRCLIVETGEEFEGQQAFVVDWFEGVMANFNQDDTMGVP